MIERLEIIIDTDTDEAEVEITMSGTNLLIAAGKILELAAKKTGIDIELLAMSLIEAEAGKNETK